MPYIEPLSRRIKGRLMSASQTLRTADPSEYVGHILDDSFAFPMGDPRYARNALLPGAAPLEPVFGAGIPRALSFTLEPLGPEASGADRRDSTTREMRRLVADNFGSEALHWFDGASEHHRGFARSAGLNFGAFFGSSFDNEGLKSASVTYESGRNGQGVDTVNPHLARLIGAAISAMPGLRPVFTTLIAGRDYGSQWVTFLLTTAMRLADLQPVLDELGLGPKLSQILQVLGIALGGRFDLPAGAALIGFGRSPEGVELEIQVMLDAIPDLPPNFLQLLTMNLRERPRELVALERFLEAFTPEDNVWPGRFSVLGLRIAPSGPPKVSLYLRPVEFEVTPASAIMPGGFVPGTAGAAA